MMAWPLEDSLCRSDAFCRRTRSEAFCRRTRSEAPLVLANGPHSQEEPLGLIDDGVWLRLDPYDQPLRVVFEKVSFDDNGAVDLVIHWTTVGISEDMVSA
jgi:hypothetical protein